MTTTAEASVDQQARTGAAATLVLVGGHESGRAAHLQQLCRDAGDDGGPFRAVPVGRELTTAVTDALAHFDRPVCVLPMTLGRDPGLVADTARALRWLTGPGDRARGRIVLADPFGTPGHLIGWLRAAAGRTAGPRREDCAMLVAAPAAGPFEDAELFRIARLVSRHGSHRRVEVAFEGGDPGLPEGVMRCLRLGARRVVLLSAGFGPASPRPVQDAEDGGPLLGAPALTAVLRARTADALHRLAHGDDGIAAGLDAEHGHGYAHSHGPDDHQHPHQH
ncbi:sirohydrochlorin cobaltochelatase [Kitasatospora sp. MAA4]|uniref:sirohydrochlorin chelatase n=1 Tax=Kitasatospora sp. MAA4 TaxID=3035093 RepID=UPI002473A5F5|nr:cobalamin biosynthesis protein CbiX [Kitasatospora sp. MAA4]MDH6130662.1 sirohydrochlorin cobaltochelatase [Kitasatospora sp. MAA4]